MTEERRLSLTQQPEKKDKKKGLQNPRAAGIAIGVGVGLALGSAMDNVASGLAVGTALGVAIGAGMQRKRDSDSDEK